MTAERLSIIVLAGLVLSFSACNRAPSNKPGEVQNVAKPHNTQVSTPAAPASSATVPQQASALAPSSRNASSDAPQLATGAKVVAADKSQDFTVAQQAFRLITHTQTIEGMTDETVDWWELRNAKDRVIYHGTYPVTIENGSFADTLAITGSAFNTADGGGILIHGFELPSAPGDGGWVQLFGFKYGREKYGVDENLFGAFGPPISVVEGEFLGVGTDPLRLTPVSFGSANATAMHDVLRFRLWTGNFSVVYPVLINWITGRLQPAWRCIESTSKVERCPYPITAEAHRDGDQPTFVRLFPEPGDGWTPKHIIVQPQSKVEFIEALCPVTWDQDDKSISFSVRGDNWLKVKIDGVEGWIHGQEDFDAIGLPESG